MSISVVAATASLNRKPIERKRSSRKIVGGWAVSYVLKIMYGAKKISSASPVQPIEPARRALGNFE
jgi:hypothetical protein